MARLDNGTDQGCIFIEYNHKYWLYQINMCFTENLVNLSSKSL
jgi:hypothetical protein